MSRYDITGGCVAGVAVGAMAWLGVQPLVAFAIGCVVGCVVGIVLKVKFEKETGDQ